jgi:AraC-like DNA-binding protein
MRLKVGVKAYGRIVSWEGASLWMLEVQPGEGEFPRTDFHSHHAVQISLALRGQFELCSKQQELRAEVLAGVTADTAHAFHQRNGLVAHLFVAPESRAGRAIARTFFDEGSVRRFPIRSLGDLPDRLAAVFARRGDVDQKLMELGRAVVARLAPEAVGEPPDGRVERVIAWTKVRLDGPVSLRGAAQSVGLSPSRLRHLFVAQTGLPFRVFLLWLRITKAVELFAAGASLTESAHAAGFADSAHFSRMFRRMYGIAASSLRVE